MEKTSFKENLRTALTVGAVVGFFIGLFGGSIVSGLLVGLIVGLISCIMFSNDEDYYPIMGLLVGSFFGGTIGLLIGVFADVIYIGLFVGGTVGGYTTFVINDKNKKLLIEYENQIDKYANNIEIYADSHIPLKLGVENPVKITVNNKTETTISNIHLKSNFPKSVICNETIALIDEISAESSESKTLFVTPTVANEIDLDELEITLEINGNPYEKEPVEIGIFDVIPPEIDIQIDVPNPLKVGMENPVKITVKNQSDVPLSNVQIKTNFSRLIVCDETTVHTDDIPANSSEYTAIFITPRMTDKINLGDLNISYDINDNTYEKEPIAIGTYEAIEVNSHKAATHTGNVNSDLSISRETEFYQGFIRFKMSVTNTSSFVVNDVALYFDYDNNLLRIDRHEPDYQIKNGRTIFGNISGNSSKTIAVYFDPMMCSKGTDINCQVNYKDAKGQPQTTHMEPKKISVVCPIMETESDINIGRLKEFIEKLSYRDSKVYQIQNGFEIDVLKNISREIVQKHDVKHIRTFFTKDRSTCEIWYYGKTKVHGHDIVIKITILSETQNIELFAATQTVESLAGLLAEVGRELKGAIESKVTGNVQQVINVSIKDSIVQRSNLLSHCDIDGNCTGDVVIEDSLVQRSDVGFGIKTDNSLNVPVKTPSTELKEDNLDEINKYGAAALKSVKLLQSDKSKNPTEVWDIVTKEIFGHGTSSQKKGCPKNTFLGLCGEGLIKGVPKGNYTNSKENKKYALKAVEILKKNPHLAFNINALWNEVVDEPKVHNSQMNVVIALWNNDFINNFDVVSIIKKRFAEVGNPAQIPLLKGNGSFEAKLSNDGISVDNLGNSPFLPWDVFIESVSLLHENGGQAKRGDAMNSKLGDEKLPLNSIEGHVAHVVYGKQIGDRITIRRITPIACILIWVKICQHKSGELLLSNNYVMMSDQIGENNSEEKKKGERMNLNKHEIHEYLTGIAKEQRKVTYGDVMRECGEEVNGAAIANKLIKQILDPISEENIQNKEPLLTALVVNGKTGIPGPGFLKKWMETYRDYIGPSDGPEAQKAHSEELERVFNYWHDGNENSCPACGEVVPDAAKFCMECGEKIN